MKLHFVGIGGSGISGVAFLAEKSGYTVTGCDSEENTAYTVGETLVYGNHILKGHSALHIKDADLVVTSPALFYQHTENPEILEAKKQRKLITWQEFLGSYLLKDKKVICIAGTHGKSTTTAMVGKMLIDNGFDPIVMVGAYVPEWGGNSRFGRGEYAVIEADEFNNNFLNYHPEIIVLNNIEFDHPDFFKDEAAVRDSFAKFIKNLKGKKVLITEKDSLNKKFNLKILGSHNQKNANMAFLLGRQLGISDTEVVKSIEGFNGIGRRLELIADYGGIKVFDDYAHHPTAIKTTLEGVRSEYPDKKILVIDEPHGYKRTKALLDNYKGVFDSADKVIIGPIYKARDEVDESITPKLVASNSNHKNAVGLNSFDEIIENWKDLATSSVKNGNYDIIVVMGAGKSYLWAREIVKLLPVKFSDVTTFKIGGKIKKYLEVKNKEELVSAVKYAKENNLPIFIIGGGSDILVSDSDFNGMVIKYTGNSVRRIGDSLVVEAGMNWDKLVGVSVENGLQGMECLSGIPGTVGAAPIQNIGAYGAELKDSFNSLEAFDIEKEKFIQFSKEDCKFSYRNSVFKTPDFWQKFIIVSVTFKLSKNSKPEIKYHSVVIFLKEKSVTNPTLADTRNAVLEIRKGKFEDPTRIGNAGSFFKNPIVSTDVFQKLLIDYPDVKYFEQEGNFKIFAGWLIEKAGWKGKSYKTAAVSSKHALILINPKGTATAKDEYELSEKIIQDVYEKFGVKLEREVQLINF